MRSLVWIAVLSCLVPPGSSASGNCYEAKAASSATCSAATTIASVLTAFTCAVTLGVGCGATVAVAAISGVCLAIAGNVPCPDSAGVDPALAKKLNKITHYLRDIENSVEEISLKIDIEFFEAKYITYINKIRAAERRYDLDVVQKNMDRNGMIRDTQLVRDWVNDALGDGDYNVRGALDIIEGMVTGVHGISRTPSVYELAMRLHICTGDLSDFMTYLITEGTILSFIALELRGDGVHQADKDQLAERIKLNREMFLSNCAHFEPSNSRLRYDGLWGDWGKQELCPINGYVVSYKLNVQQWQHDGDDTALNSICLICNTGDEICSKGKSWGEWSEPSAQCSKGFYGADLRFEPNQGNEDDTGANDFKLKCRDENWITAGNGETRGDWLGFQACRSGEVVCGLKTRVQDWQGERRRRCIKIRQLISCRDYNDNTVLNGVELVCCRDKWEKYRAGKIAFKGR